MDKFKNIYRIPSARAQWWNYGNNAAYFITICTAYREEFFGNVINKKMQLSPIGVIADVFWHEIKKHFNNIELREFVVMPNHIHGILVINKQQPSNVTPVETRHALSHTAQKPQSPGQQRIRNQGENTISSVIGGYKSVVTNHVRRLGYDFKWQSRFHDHIIEDELEYQRIADYIIENPKNWENDKFYTNKQI